VTKPPLKYRLKELVWIAPLAIAGGFAVGVVAAVVRLWLRGDLSHGLWRTGVELANTTLNACVYGAVSLGLFVALVAALQILFGRRTAPALRAAIGFNLFFPLFMVIVWVATERAIEAFSLATHKLPELIRQNDNLGRFLLENYLASLDVVQVAKLLLVKAGWMIPAILMAALLGVWVERIWTRLAARRRRPPQASSSPRVARAVTAVVIIGAVLIVSNMAALAARLTNREPRPNVILISLDTLRADRLGCYGNEHARTPVLDKLAANGVLFEDAVSNSSWTLPGHGAMLTGVQPGALGLFKVTDRLSPRALTLAEVMREHGFDTGAIVSYILLDKVYGFDQGFEHFDYVDNQPASDIVDKAIAYIAPRQQQKFFLFLHMYDTHWPYEPSEETAREFWPHYLHRGLRQLIDTGDYARFALQVVRGPEDFNDYCRAMYDGEIHDVDAQLGRLFHYLIERGLDNRTIVVVTSDHGEEFLDHGLFGHGLTLYDEAIRVPLIMRFPHLLPSGARVTGQVQSLDLFPTILGLTGLDPTTYNLGGRDLLFSAAAGQVEPVPMISETTMSGDQRYALRDGRLKLLTPFNLDFGHGLTVERDEEVFDLSADPHETANLAPTHPKMAEVLRQKMAETLAEVQQRWGQSAGLTHSKELSAEEIERLRSLGYIQ
jgi:arylsulfatase A-like enzyme